MPRIPKHVREAQNNPLCMAVNQMVKSGQIRNLKDCNEILNTLFKHVVESLPKEELEETFGHDHNDEPKGGSSKRRNGHSKKTALTTGGELEIDVPRDREGEFEPVIVPKHKSFLSEIEDKVTGLYARGMSLQDIADSINELYCTSFSKADISRMTDSVIETMEEWRSRPLKECYPFVIIDCLFVSVKDGALAKKRPLYVAMGIDVEGHKEVLAIDMAETESASDWADILSGLKRRGVKHIFYVCMNDLSGLPEIVKSFYPEATAQRCTVHLIRNASKYVMRKNLAEFCRDARQIYNAIDVKAAEATFASFKAKWGERYPAAVQVWERNWNYLEQLFNTPEAVRKVIYTTNAVESLHSSLRKVVEKDSFADRETALKAAYIRISRHLAQRWDRAVNNWKRILAQLMLNENHRKILAGQSSWLNEYAASFE